MKNKDRPPSAIANETGFKPNGIFYAAESFLDTALLKMENERATSNSFLWVGQWHVVHHLAFIASELFLKSVGSYVFYDQIDESGPGIIEEYPSHNGHGGVPEEILTKLQPRLSENHQEMLSLFSNKSLAKLELARGRYPYEVLKDGQTRYPDGPEGYEQAEKWVQFAAALRDAIFSKP